MPNLPPGPINFLAPFGLTYRHYISMRIHPMRFVVNMARKYGDISFFRFFYHPVVLINHPEFIREVLISQAGNFPKYDRIRNHLRQATGDGLLVTEGEPWREQRVSIQKIFQSHRMDVFGKITSEYASDMLDRWSHLESVKIEDEMTLLIQAIMGKCFFGFKPEPGHHIADAVRNYSDVFHLESRALFNLPDWFPIKSKFEKRKSIRILKESIQEIVSQRIKFGERREDLLDMLLYSSGTGSSGTGAPDAKQPPVDSVVELAGRPATPSVRITPNR